MPFLYKQINGLRMSFTLNTSLKRLFLADTGLATEGAIALAEFLPETEHLLHLDLTKNQGIEVAGIMALAVGLRSNRVMRCLDLSIPFNNSDVASLSQDILQVGHGCLYLRQKDACSYVFFWILLELHT